MSNLKRTLKNHFEKRYKAYILLGILVLPIIFTLVLSVYFMGDIDSVGNEIQKFKGNLLFQINDFPTFSEIIYYLICTYTLIITGIFSWSILQSSIKSNKLAEELKNKEDNKEYESIRENALIVYYDLILGIKDLKNLYVSRIINKENPIPRKMFFSNEWIKNVAVLKNNLSGSEINDIYSLYGKFLTIASLLDDGQSLNNNYSPFLDEEISKLVDEIYSSVFPKAFLITYKDAAEKLLNHKYYLLLEKLRTLTYTKDQYRISEDYKAMTADIYLGNSRLYRGGFKENNFNGEGNYYLPNGKIKYKGVFKEGYFVSGIAREFYNNDNIMYEINYEDGIKISGKLFYEQDTKLFGGNLCYDGSFKDNSIKDGFAELYHRDGFSVLYRGYLSNEKYAGRGVEYYKHNSAEYDGTWDNGEILNGEYFGNGKNEIKYFKGEFKYSIPYTGVIKYGSKYTQNYVNAFEGELKEGKLHNGKGMVLFLNSDGYDYTNISILIEQENEDSYYDEHNDDNEKWQKELQFQDIKANYSQWEEFIEAEWHNGEVKIKEDDILNKEIFYYTDSKIEKTKDK